MKKILLIVLVMAMAVTIGVMIGIILQSRREATPPPVSDESVAALQGKQFVWGATVRPFVIRKPNEPFNRDSIDKQFKYVKDLFPVNGCVRANIEGDPKINDILVENAQKYNLQLYLILEEIKDFNPDINYEQKAADLAQKIVARYKGKVAYYQLSNELSGVVFSQPNEKGETMDGGYGLKIDKNRYEHVKRYAIALSKAIRSLDPDAKIVISGHWVLIKPILQLINEGVSADIIGWNWGTSLGEEAGSKNIDNYGLMDIPKMAKAAGKDFMIIEANRDDGSMNGKESEQASYIKKLSQSAYNNPNISGYFHFILTDGIENQPGSYLGLIKVKQDQNGSFVFGELKPSYNILRNFAANNY